MRILGAIFRLVIGAIFGVGAAAALIPAEAALTANGSASAVALFLGIAVAGALLCLFARDVRHAFGRGFLFLGACVFALPLSSMLLAGSVAHHQIEQASMSEKAGTAIGAGIAGIMVTGASAVVGFFFGTVLLIIGLVLALGGRREVVIVERRARREPTV